jgi:hypothetical protein
LAKNPTAKIMVTSGDGRIESLWQSLSEPIDEICYHFGTFFSSPLSCELDIAVGDVHGETEVDAFDEGRGALSC